MFYNATKPNDGAVSVNTSIHSQSNSNVSIVEASTFILYFMDHICEPQTGLSMAFDDMKRENLFGLVPYNDQLQGRDRDIKDDGENFNLKREILEVNNSFFLKLLHEYNQTMIKSGFVFCK
jgi:hypothetical protein